MPIEIKYRCPICGYESNASGICPVDDENMQKLCHCGSGKYSLECCNLKENQETAENEELIAAEVKSEDLEERIKEAEVIEDEPSDDNSDEN